MCRPHASTRASALERSRRRLPLAGALSSTHGRPDASLGGVPPPAAFDASLWYRTLFAQSALGVTLADGQRLLIESWFSRLKQRCIWREEFETLDEAREAIGRYVDRYHHRPRQGLAYRTPREVAATWKDHDDQSIPAA